MTFFNKILLFPNQCIIGRWSYPFQKADVHVLCLLWAPLFHGRACGELRLLQASRVAFLLLLLLFSFFFSFFVHDKIRRDFKFGQLVKEALHNGLVLHVQEERGTSINHFFLLHCEVARDLWVSISLLFGLEWLMPQKWRSCWCAREVNICLIIYVGHCCTI